MGRSLDRVLRLFTDVRDGEGAHVVLLALDVFLILTAYYVMKPVREALILAQPGGAELKSYAAAAQAVLLVAVVPLYGALATRLPRRRLVNAVTAFFILSLGAFYLLAVADAPIAVPFYLWIGTFSLMVIAQFWAYANDIHTPEAGERLFALVAFGGSSGAVFGSWLAGLLIDAVGVPPLLLVAAGILAASLVLFNVVERRVRRGGVPGRPAAEADRPIGDGDPFGLVFRHRYLLLIALLILLINWVNTTGEYIMGRIVSGAAAAAVQTGALEAGGEGTFIGGFYARFFAVVNVVGMTLQLLVVARVITHLGVTVAVCLPPLLALGSYAAVAVVPILGLIRWVKTAENSVDYSLQTTVRQVLFLPTTREEKYKAKQAIDTFFVRAGDVLSAVTVFVGTTILALGVAHFALVNVGLVVVWLVVAVAVGREFGRQLAARDAA